MARLIASFCQVKKFFVRKKIESKRLTYSKLSHVMRKSTGWFPNRSDTILAVQGQKMTKGREFWICKVEELYYPGREKKALISFAVIAKLICPFVSAYAKCWFSYDAAQLSIIVTYWRADGRGQAV